MLTKTMVTYNMAVSDNVSDMVTYIMTKTRHGYINFEGVVAYIMTKTRQVT